MLSTRLARVPTLATLARRAYSENPGSVAKSREFSKKERAHEDQYARQKEQEELKKLREQIQKKAQELEELGQKVDKLQQEKK